jgi:hypothetical protein
MNRISLPSPGSLGLAALMALALGCNGAQLSTPPPIDSGPPCESYAPAYKACDAGPAATGPVCTANGTGDENLSRIPSGTYPVGCQVQFYFDLNGGGCQPAPSPCICFLGDAGGGDAEAVPGQWNNCADAGLQLIE